MTNDSTELKANRTEPTNQTKSTKQETVGWSCRTLESVTKPTGLLELGQSGVAGQIGCRVVSRVAATYNYFFATFLPSYPCLAPTYLNSLNGNIGSL